MGSASRTHAGISATRVRFTRCTLRARCATRRKRPSKSACVRFARDFLPEVNKALAEVYSESPGGDASAKPAADDDSQRSRRPKRPSRRRLRRPNAAPVARRRRPNRRRRRKTNRWSNDDGGASRLRPIRNRRAFLHHADAAVFQAEPLHLLVERRAIDAELVGGGVAVPAVRFQHFANDLPLGAFERFLQRSSGRRLM